MPQPGDLVTVLRESGPHRLLAYDVDGDEAWQILDGVGVPEITMEFATDTESYAVVKEVGINHDYGKVKAIDIAKVQEPADSAWFVTS